MTYLPAKKSLGQNFLNSPGIAKKILDISGIGPEDTVLEIGPGKGMLTEILLARAKKVVAIEKDARAMPILQERFAAEIASGRFEVIEGDIMEWNPAAYVFGGPNSSGDKKYSIVANIPYYITGEVIRKFLTSGAKPSSMTLMLQKEVADRIVARDGKESLLSISVKVFGTPRYGMTVKAGSFTPAPTIDSAVLHIADISDDFFNDKQGGGSDTAVSESKFFEIARAGFAHKRKQLVGNLSQIFPRESVEEALVAAGLGENVRAEELTIGQWKTISKLLSA